MRIPSRNTPENKHRDWNMKRAGSNERQARLLQAYEDLVTGSSDQTEVQSLQLHRRQLMSNQKGHWCSVPPLTSRSQLWGSVLRSQSPSTDHNLCFSAALIIQEILSLSFSCRNYEMGIGKRRHTRSDRKMARSLTDRNPLQSKNHYLGQWEVPLFIAPSEKEWSNEPLKREPRSSDPKICPRDSM